jgi:hypothetical protein
MTEDILAMSFTDLRTLHRDLSALIAERRNEALATLQNQIAALGFSPEEIGGRKKRGKKKNSGEEFA